ncbi:MAG: 50S ribosomal protein L9 [Candidatus Omnitrophica bacterium 4484_213]|nr:MAG: 50S ribosomal protein L9 [Candidatus Omnitrophica bacterium 4484_213]
MKVILLTDIPKLGKAGGIVEVKDGYARNFLIPKKLALAATPQSIQLAQQKREQELKKKKAEREKINKLAEELSKTSCTISALAGKEDKLFGEITNKDIAEALVAKGLEIDKKKIEIEEPIRKLGVYNVKVKLCPEVIANLRVWVIKKKDGR